MRLRKRLGQHFLRDRNILKKEVETADLRGSVVLEIGAGDGRLSSEILDGGAKKLYAVEKDKRFVEHLHEKFAQEKRMEILDADFLEMELPKDVEIVIGNIPYYISSKIIFRLKNTRVKRAVLIVQKEFGEKMVAEPNDSNYGRLSVTSRLAFDVKFIQKIPKHLFTPQPKVDSALIVLKPTGLALTEKEENIIRKLFQHKNRKIRNSLPDIGEKWADKRPRELSPKEVLQLVKDYSENSTAS